MHGPRAKSQLGLVELSPLSFLPTRTTWARKRDSTAHIHPTRHYAHLNTPKTADIPLAGEAVILARKQQGKDRAE